MNKKKLFLYVLGFSFLSVMWFYQYENSMQYQRFIALRIGGYLVEMKSVLEKNMVPGEKLRTSLQKDLLKLNIEVYGRQIDLLTGALKPQEALKEFAALNAKVLEILKRDKIEEYFFYGKKHQVVKMFLEPLCASKNPEEEKKGLVIDELNALLSLERALALGRINDSDTVSLRDLLKTGKDFEESCHKFLKKNPLHTLGRLQQGIDHPEN